MKGGSLVAECATVSDAIETLNGIENLGPVVVWRHIGDHFEPMRVYRFIEGVTTTRPNDCVHSGEAR